MVFQPKSFVGRQFADYKLLELIGSGPNGAVFRAPHKFPGKHLAVKIMPRTSLDRLSAYRDCPDHPAVVPFFDLGIWDDYGYVVTKFVEGGSLADHLAGGRRVEASRAADLMARVLDILREIHRTGAVHGNLTPANILVSHTGKLWLSDFGMARELSLENSDQQAGYLSPEQCHGRMDPDLRSDLFSVGLILYQCLSGLTPTSGMAPTQNAYNRVNQPIQPIAEVVSGLDPALAALTDELLAPDRERRPESADIVLDRLSGLAAS